jgi:hypothetical protein
MCVAGEKVEVFFPAKKLRNAPWEVVCKLSCSNTSLKAEVCTPVSQQYMVPRVCRKWGIYLSSKLGLKSRKFCFGRIMYLLIAWGLLPESSKRICPESCFFYHQPVSLYCTYVLCTRGHCNISLIEDLVQLRAQKYKPTMVSADSPRAANPKMVESPDSMEHASSSYSCAEDGYFKLPHTASIDGDIWWDSCWFFVGFGFG